MDEPLVMPTTSEAISTLRSAGVVVSHGTAAEWTLRLPNNTHSVVSVKTFRNPPSAAWLQSDLMKNPGRRLLAIVHTVPARLEGLARKNLVDVVNVRTGSVIIGSHEWATPVKHDLPRDTANPPWGRWGVIRTLYLSRAPLTQTELAGHVGIAQSAVSQILRDMEYVERTEKGWIATDKNRLLPLWRDGYVGPRGTTTYWLGLAAVTQQAAAAAELAQELEIKYLVTGDVAADDYAPWRLPAQAHLYVDELVDFSVMNLTPTGPEDATLVSTVPEDQTIWNTANSLGSSPHRADPLIIYWDVLNSVGPDTEEAAEKILEAIPR